MYNIISISFFQSGIRGGISTITKRLATANNPHAPDYDPSKKLVHLLYVDANNLYGELRPSKMSPQKCPLKKKMTPSKKRCPPQNDDKMISIQVWL